MENYSDSSDSVNDIFLYDIFKKCVIEDCSLNPTEVTREEVEWLYAVNNKYEDYDSKKVGKWMIFPPENEVNSLWNKIKEAIKKGDLWQSKVSPSDPPNGYAIMIYTVDYTDKKDVIDVLTYLEKSGIKPANRVIKYKTDEQTRAGLYAGGTQKSSIYASNTIREEYACNRTRTSNDYRLYTFTYDILKKQIIDDCSLNPTEITQEKTGWLHAVNNKYDYKFDSLKVGKWMVFLSKDDVNSIWNKVKEGIKAGDLWKSKVSTANLSENYIIMIFTKDYTDKKDVIDVLNYLEVSGIKPENTIIKYKTNEQTRAGITAGGTQKSSIYASHTIREEYTCNRTGKSNDHRLYTFTYDILKKQIIDDCSFNPTDITQEETDWLYARNNKYEDYDSKKVGKWMIFLSKDDVNSIWNKVKEGIKAGDLWMSKVLTVNPCNKYVIMIFTKNYNDRKDVISVLNYLEMSGIKPANTIITYNTNKQTRASIIAGEFQNASNTIRKNYGNKRNTITNWRTPSATSSNTIRKNDGNKTNTITNWRTPSDNGATTSSKTSHF